jgi:orotate phosphoribosyltransferase
MDAAWLDLLDLLFDRSYRRAESPTFRLSSGKLSDFYIDCKVTTMCGEAMPLVGELIARHLPPGTQSVGGLTMGADWIAAAVAHHCTTHGRRVDAFSVRKEPKKHGTRKWIEGCAAHGSKVVVVDDVVTTGGSTIDAIRKCREEGLEVMSVVALVDREEEGGREAIIREAGPGVPFAAVYKRSDFDARAESRRHVPSEPAAPR